MHMYPHTILLIKSNNDTKSDKDCVKTKLRRDPTAENSDL